MVIDGTYIVSGKYAVHVKFDEFLAELEYRQAVEELQQIGAVAIPDDSRYITNGDLQVEKDYRAIQDSLDLSQWDLENSEKDSGDWTEAREAVENFKAELKEYLTLDHSGYSVIVDKETYKKTWGEYPDPGSIEYLIGWYHAFAANECVHVAIIPLVDGSEGWEDKIESFDYCDISDLGGEVIPVPDSCLLDHEVIKLMNDNGYPVKDNAKFLEVTQ